VYAAADGEREGEGPSQKEGERESDADLRQSAHRHAAADSRTAAPVRRPQSWQVKREREIGTPRSSSGRQRTLQSAD
jgi:hypothetical protein